MVDNMANSVNPHQTAQEQADQGFQCLDTSYNIYAGAALSQWVKCWPTDLVNRV